MKKGGSPIISLLVLLFLVGTFSIVFLLSQKNQNLQSQALKKDSSLPKYQSSVVPNEIIVKLQPNSVPDPNMGNADLDLMDVPFDRIPRNKLPQTFASLDKVYKIKSIQKVFKKRPAATLPSKKKIKLASKPPASSLIYLLKFKNNTSLLNVRQILAQQPQVQYVEFNSIFTISAYPNDPYFKDQIPPAPSRNQNVGQGGWNPPFDYQWALKRIGPEQSWEQTKGNANLVIAVIDTGIDYNHPELAGKIIKGYNFVHQNTDPMDDHSHGTHLAGIIGAQTNNNTGIAGVNPASPIMAIKGLDSKGSGTVANLAASIDYARSNGAKIINASWGAMGDSPTLKFAVDTALSSGIVFVAAAGNNGSDSRHFMPAKYRGVISVGASDTLDQTANFSNTLGIDLVAPGGNSTSDPENLRNILSLKSSQAIQVDPALIVENIYLRQAGTSMAAPFVTAAASMLLSKNANLTAEQIRSILKNTAYKKDNLSWTPDRGFGRLDLSKALDAANTPNIARITSPDSTIFSQTDTNSIEFIVDGPNISSWLLDFGSGVTPSNWYEIAQGTNQGTSLTANIETKNLEVGTYSIRLRALRNSTSPGPDFEDRLIIAKPLKENWRATLPPGDNSFVSGPTVVRLDDQNSTYNVLVSSQTGIQMYDTLGNRIRTIPWPSGESSATNFSLPTVGKLLSTVPGNQILMTSHKTQDSSLQVHMFDKNGVEIKNQGWPKNLGFYNAYVPRPITMTLSELAGDDKLYVLSYVDNRIQIFDGEGNTLNANWPKQMPGHSANLVFANKFINDSTNELQILAIDNEGRTTIFDLNGQALSNFNIPVITNDLALVLTDLTNDGTKEIIVKYSLSNPSIIADQKVVAYKSDGQILWEKTIGPQGFNGGFPTFTVADLDGDSKNEIITSDENKLIVFNQAGTLLDSWSQTPQTNILNVVSADLDKDKVSDLYFDTSIPTQIGMISKASYKYVLPYPGIMLFDSPEIADLSGGGRLTMFVAAPFGAPLISYEVGNTGGSHPELTWPKLQHDNWHSNSDGVCVKNGCDLNRDGQANSQDIQFFQSCFGKGTLLASCRTADFNCDTYVTLLDFSQYRVACHPN